MVRVAIVFASAMLVLGAGIAGAQAAAPVDGGVRVGVLTDGTGEAWTAFRDTAMKEALAAGITLEFRMLSPATAEQQAKAALEMIAAGAKALAVCPVDPAQQKAFFQEVAGKVPLVLLNKDVADSGRLCFVGMDEKEAGKKISELVTQLVPYGMKVAVLVRTGDTGPEKARMEALKEGLAPSEFIVEATKADKGDRNLAWAGADELMTKHIELAAYIAFEPYQLPALLRAATAHKMAGIVVLIGFVESAEMQEAFASGKIQGAVRPDAAAQAKQTLEVLRGVAAKDAAYKLPENGVIGIAPLIEKTPKPMTNEEKLDALQIPRVLEETPAPARPSFE